MSMNWIPWWTLKNTPNSVRKKMLNIDEKFRILDRRNFLLRKLWNWSFFFLLRPNNHLSTLFSSFVELHKAVMFIMLLSWFFDILFKFEGKKKEFNVETVTVMNANGVAWMYKLAANLCLICWKMELWNDVFHYIIKIFISYCINIKKRANYLVNPL